MEMVLLTGANGFVGSEIAEHLLKLNKDFVAIGRTKPRKNIRFIEADITDYAALKAAVEGSPFDYIIHIASLPSDTGDPQQMVNVNVNGCLNMLEIAHGLKVKRIVIVSSISAYEWYPATKFNKPDYLPVNEDHPCRPKNMYSVTKRMQELLAITYFEQYQVPATVLRLTAVIGPRGEGGGRGWRKIAEQLEEGKMVQLPHFSANEMCHYVDIRDAARMCITAAEHPNAAGQIFNCCGPAPIRGYEFTEIIKKLFPGIEVEYGFPWSMAQGGEIAFDMSKAKKLLEFIPEYDVEDSIKYMKEWIENGGLTESHNIKRQNFEEGIEK